MDVSPIFTTWAGFAAVFGAAALFTANPVFLGFGVLSGFAAIPIGFGTTARIHRKYRFVYERVAAGDALLEKINAC